MNETKSGGTDPADRVAGSSVEGHRSPLTIGRAVAVTAVVGILVGVIVGPILVNDGVQAADPTGTVEHTITVAASGEVSVSPDVADVYLGISVKQPSAKDARSAAATQMAAVVAAVKGLGVADKDIVTTNVSLSAVYDYSATTGSRLTGYLFSNTVKVTVRDIEAVAGVIDGAVSAGATTVQGISFRLDNPKPLESQARTLAMNDARAKADALAGAAGVHVTGVASISETVVSSPAQYTPSPVAYDKAAASTPIQTGTTDIEIRVTVAYLIG